MTAGQSRQGRQVEVGRGRCIHAGNNPVARGFGLMKEPAMPNREIIEPHKGDWGDRRATGDPSQA